MEKSAVFARKASGLTREASMIDAAFFGIMNIGVPTGAWFVLGAYAWAPGANVLIAALIIFLLTVFGLAFVFGILGGSMPRSGGEYVYNSRIIHPVIGMAESFCTGAFVQLAWLWVLAPWIGQIGMPMMGAALGWNPAVVNWFTQDWGLFLITTVVNFSGMLIVMAGMRAYFNVQKVFVLWSLIGVIIPAAILAFTSHAHFVAGWNQYSAQYHSLNYDAFVSAVGKQFTIPKTWNWHATIGMLLPVSWLSIYSYVIAYIGGEVKSPRKNLFIAQIINQIVPLGIVVFLCVAYSRAVGWNGMHAIAWISNNNLNGFNLPFKPTYVDIASMVIGHSKIIGFIMAMAFIMADWLYVPSSYICWSRASFAWGMDNFGPKWFTELNSRTGQPIWPLLLMFVASEIAIAQYSWHPNFLGGFSVEVLEMITVFGISAISAIMLPYVGKVRFIWKTSPYHDWKIAGIPVVSISGVLLLIMVVLLVYSYYTASALQFLYSVWTWIFVGVWAIGVGWYYWWKWVKAKEGIDVTLAFTELPPE